MENSNLLLGNTFSKFRERPKWILNLIIWIVVVIGSLWLTFTFSDWTEVLKQTNPDVNQAQVEQAKSFMGPITIIAGFFTQMFYLLAAFLIVWAIARIFKSDVKKKSIFAGTLFALLISSIVALIVLAIQVIVGLDIVNVSITSLNIFDQGNKILGVFNLQTLLSGYLFGLLLYKTCKLSGRVSIIFGILLVIITMGSGLIGAFATS
ncbi:YIP1 family protein [Staphylococcus simulans]|uniref:YIP1 family protein n=1 Tax=Staphylococcus simulans TaxID=1286 RepID=UPI00399A13C1